MIPPLKIKCKKQQYCADGSCRYLGKVKDREPCPCLKQNCIYYDGETNERDTVLDDLCNIDLTYYIWGELHVRQQWLLKHVFW